jgi:hypothetical protein
VVVEATARLYDVDDDSVVFTRLQNTNRYDHGSIKFEARKGELIDLDKLHENIWATRLSGGTSSGLVSLEVTAVGELVETEKGTMLKVANSDAEFALGKHTDEKHASAFANLKAAGPNRRLRVTGLIDNYSGRWPTILNKPPAKPRRILVTEFKVEE